MKKIFLLTIGYKRVLLVLHGLFLIFTVIFSVLLGTCIFSVPREIILSNENKIQNLVLEIMFTLIFLFIGVLLIVNYFVRNYFEDESSNLEKLFDIGQGIPDLFKYLRNTFLYQELILFFIDLFLYIILSSFNFRSVIVIFLKLCILINIGFRFLYSGFIIVLLRKIFK